MERKKIFGNPQKIDLSTSSFERMRKNENLYIDKTRIIEHFLDEPNSVQLIVRPRRLGKSLNLDTICCFLDEQQDTKPLFEGLYIENSHHWDKINSAPVLFFDFKNLKPQTYKAEIKTQIIREIERYADVEKLKGYQKIVYDELVRSRELISNGLLFLTEIVHSITGKTPYIFIDEYDKLLTDSYPSDQYEEIRSFETTFLSAGLKGNKYLEKALLTGVMRVSRENMMSGLNNLQTYNLFEDQVYTKDFGLTEEEMQSLSAYYSFDHQEMKDWYNGICINGLPVYNIYSVLSCLQSGKTLNYWGRSGVVDMIASVIDERRMADIETLLGGGSILSGIEPRVSLHQLSSEGKDNMFYSFLAQAGYVAICDIDHKKDTAVLRIPNKELMKVWKDFILSDIVIQKSQIRTMFDNIHDMALLSGDIEYFLNDRLSYFDIGKDTPTRGGRMSKTKERIYHIFVLGILSAYEDISYQKLPLSNRESGGGRYDILFERKDYSIIFEFKSIDAPARTENLRAELEKAAEEALKQIEKKRYFAEAPKDKPIIQAAVAFCGKQCAVKCASRRL